MFRKAPRTVFAVISLLLLSLTAAAAQQLSVAPVEHARLLGALALEGEVFHVQGVDLDNRRIWVTSVDRAQRRGYLHEFDRATGRLLRRVELTDGARYHPGGISLHGDAIWVPVAEMTPNSSAVIEEIDTATLRIRRRIPVTDHLGCVAVSDSMLIAGNWDSRLLYVFDRRDGDRVRIVPNPSATPFQDIKLIGGQLVGGGPLTLWSGTIDWIDLASMTPVRSLRAGATDRAAPYSGEGMTLKGRDLYLISEDGPSRLFHFRLDV